MPDYKLLVEDFLHDLDGWERAYPLTAFPEPDLKRAAELLKAGGMTLDAVSASNMRHVVSKIAPPAREAITSLSHKLEEMREALEEIASPIAAMQKRAKAHGTRLSGMAYQIANDPAYLQGIARQVLSDHVGEEKTD